jgi:Asp-tRNA(Asn)/Glu-tRNA(Gln) amidotransferase A subunit family amidase
MPLESTPTVAQSASELVRRLRSGEMSAESVALAYLERGHQAVRPAVRRQQSQIVRCRSRWARKPGGSIIRPASFCGVFAMKPTWGLVSYEGAKSSAPSLDTLGWFGRSVEDLILMYDIFEGPADPPKVIDSFLMRLGVCRSPAWEFADVRPVQRWRPRYSD